MEATNISIKQASSVSINVETLQAIKQRVLSVVVSKFSALRSQFSVWRVYRHQLRLARAVARVIDAHPTISNICLWLMGVGIMVEIFLFA